MKNKIVKLINLKEDYKQHNLHLDAIGLVVKQKSNIVTVMFFNFKNSGEYATVDVDVKDVKLLDFELPDNIKQKLDEYINTHYIYEKNQFTTISFEECDIVELLVEDKKYTKYGIHQGETGVIADDGSMVNNKVLVDFTGVDENKQFYLNNKQYTLNYSLTKLDKVTLKDGTLLSDANPLVIDYITENNVINVYYTKGEHYL